MNEPIKKSNQSALNVETLVLGAFAIVGHAVLSGCRAVGRCSLFIWKFLLCTLSGPYYWKEFAHSTVHIGYFSLPVIGLTTLFTGGALALQIYSGGIRFSAESAVPAIVAIGMIRELGPVLCGLMIAGRVGSSIAAELATMKVTEQIDALVTLSVEPMKFLVVPRVAAATLVMPLLTGIGDLIGILGGYMVGTARLGFNSHTYLSQSVQYLETSDIISGLAKGAVFGFIVALTGCYCGMNSGRGAKGVGRATTSSVAMASILIIASNFVLTDLFF